MVLHGAVAFVLAEERETITGSADGICIYHSTNNQAVDSGPAFSLKRIFIIKKYIYKSFSYHVSVMEQKKTVIVTGKYFVPCR